MALLKVNNLHYTYPDGTQALRGLSFSLDQGDRLAVVGANGCGKSTMLAHLSGCLVPPPGTLYLHDQEITEKNLKDLRRAAGLIFQDPDDQLFMPTVLEDVGFGLIARQVPREEADRLSLEALKKLSAESLANRPPHRLSGGEKRAVALAGILVMEPELLLLDEPSTALDPRARRRVINLLSQLKRPFILTTHDLDMALDLCNRVAVLSAGQVVAMGGPEILQDGPALERWGLELPLSLSSSR
ncbi:MULTISPECIES: energy-coupling factor ABC transporter ATP-binding protein [Jonquetella]|uniref:ABC-type cobalt transport system, ATPase component n=1 Tax=Jonquetella anthropi DSM 22815 TaxID=885272 RepID=H0UJF7_9BACT|nr:MULTISPECIES: ABC transporter ATP-binding protein [Jonquetella]EEX49144.1 ABC transporter, ATP-binding protein [Jonquetella anthropi E3_33 E1]EHM13924.1 ABC-type cobalt transport system, ATPase component [Jonquetella anthropi DSM 22815]ERL24217.1 ABC transporter, ATP-binding protein [Jonquetella sp. BV3C21]